MFVIRKGSCFVHVALKLVLEQHVIGGMAKFFLVVKIALVQAQ